MYIYVSRFKFWASPGIFIVSGCVSRSRVLSQCYPRPKYFHICTIQIFSKLWIFFSRHNGWQKVTKRWEIMRRSLILFSFILWQWQNVKTIKNNRRKSYIWHVLIASRKNNSFIKLFQFAKIFWIVAKQCHETFEFRRDCDDRQVIWKSLSLLFCDTKSAHFCRTRALWRYISARYSSVSIFLTQIIFRVLLIPLRIAPLWRDLR